MKNKIKSTVLRTIIKNCKGKFLNYRNLNDKAKLIFWDNLDGYRLQQLSEVKYSFQPYEDYFYSKRSVQLYPVKDVEILIDDAESIAFSVHEFEPNLFNCRITKMYEQFPRSLFFIFTSRDNLNQFIVEKQQYLHSIN